MRIVGGRLRGRSLLAPKPGALAIRPTSDRLRETIFNILAHAHDDPVPGARVIDLFAGTGALAFEALSRGAQFALLVDEAEGARGLQRGSIEALGLGGSARVFRRDATKLGPATLPPFDLAFLDPPYRRGLNEAALASLRAGGWLKPGALVVAEEAADTPLRAVEGFEILDTREAGEGAVTFLRRVGA